MRTLALLLLTLLSLPAASAEDPRISLLEQQVRALDRQVSALTQQMAALRARPDRVTPSEGAPRGAAQTAELPAWVDATKWRALKSGMSELAVISALGAPTSMRDEGGARVLLYALEIGASGFLGGSVLLRNRIVAEVRQPTLQ
jgi:hypothetical protein